MNRKHATWALVLLLPTAAMGSELSGIASLSSEYIYRGQAISGHDPAVSIGVNYEHDSGLFAGIWASTIDLESPFGKRDAEVDYYLGYHFPETGPVEFSARVMHYSYPGHTGRLDYEQTEWMLSAAFLEHYTLDFAYTHDVYGLGEPGRYWELRGEWPAATYWVFNAGIGVNDLTVLDTPSYLHWDAGLSTRYSRLTVDLRWYDNEDIAGPFRIWSAGSRFVVSLSTAF